MKSRMSCARRIAAAQRQGRRPRRRCDRATSERSAGLDKVGDGGSIAKEFQVSPITCHATRLRQCGRLRSRERENHHPDIEVG